jgi:hypothetical protein
MRRNDAPQGALRALSEREMKRRKKKTERRGRRPRKAFREKPSKKIDEENPSLSNRQVQTTFRTPLTSGRIHLLGNGQSASPGSRTAREFQRLDHSS